MKTGYLQKNRSAWRLLAAITIISAAIIAGCGGGGDTTSAGVGTGGTGSLAKTISGSVADGYLVNATVFLDRDGNYRLDAGEPVTTTDASGAYRLTVDPADVGRYPVVALARKDVTIDKDTSQTIAGSYLLSMPKDSVSDTAGSNFISPVSAQLREMMETGKYATVQQAADALRTRMGLPAGTAMTADYIAANNTAVHYAARNMATLMGNQMDQVLVTSGSTITVDVNRYRTMMGMIFSNMSTICSPDNQTGMSTLSSTMTTMLSSTPTTTSGQPYRNMSSAYRGLMGGM